MRHDQTLIHQKALELNGHCAAVINRLPRGNAVFVDQLKRAGLSVLNNFAEGCRRRSFRDRRNFFDISAASAVEVVTTIETINVYYPLPDGELETVRGLVGHLSGMLGKWE